MRRNGFTLVELMLTTAILAIAIIGVFSIYNASIVLSDMAGALTQMANIARYKLESLYTENFDSLDNHNGETFNLSGFGSDTLAVKEAKGVYKISSYSPNLKRVTASITYKTKGGRIIGEDSNLNGVLDLGEDINGDSRLSSPVELTTIIARK